MGCDIFSIVTLLSIIWFQFTHPVWGATQQLFGSWLIDTSFNSRTPCGVRHSLSCNFYTSWSFNSRTPCGVRPDSSVRTWFCWWFQFTHPVWGATSTDRPELLTLRFQFTHAVWGATSANYRRNNTKRVSIHAPRVGCDEDELED